MKMAAPASPISMKVEKEKDSNPLFSFQFTEFSK